MRNAALNLFAPVPASTTRPLGSQSWANAAAGVANDDRAAQPQDLEPLWTPQYVSPRDATAQSLPIAIKRVAIEDEVMRALTRPRHANETAVEHFARMEHELASLFQCLAVVDARLLHLRLRVGAANDDLARFFGAMVIERKSRLMRLLADAPRRVALNGMEKR